MARPPKFDDTQILDTIVDLLWREGCDAVTIRDLEVALDLKAPSIYRRFGSRERLIARSIDHYVDRFVRNGIGRYLSETDEPLAALRQVFEFGMSAIPGDQHPRGCLVVTTACQSDYGSPEVREAVDLGLSEVRAAFRSTLDRAQRQGQVRLDLPCDAMASLAFTTFQGLRVLARTGTPDATTGIAAFFELLVTLGPGTTVSHASDR
jgi:TetR/AcrR family transcriptional repressor of nem operon